MFSYIVLKIMHFQVAISQLQFQNVLSIWEAFLKRFEQLGDISQTFKTIGEQSEEKPGRKICSNNHKI